MTDAYLALETGDVVEANARAPGRAQGELVFTTAYTGYEESLTDPSYEAQVLTFAYPLIGNYGVRPERFESDRVHPSAVVARELTDDIADWLREEGVPAVDGLDTRDVVLSVREQGAMKVGIAAGPDATPEAARAELADCPHMSDIEDIGERVSVAERETHGTDAGDGANADTHVALLDCGAKRSIVDSLTDRGATVTVLPHDATPEAVAELDPDVLFVSNGPGDPANFEAAQRVVSEFVGDIPLAGICLGQQVVARALGGTTEKMEFGHRGVNQPVLDHESGRVVMTTQNHGYTVADPGDLEVTQINVNDDTPEALDSAELDVLTRQYHPEANPGPHDTLDFFDDVLAMAESGRVPLAAD
ncbi:glutamine-hydrolyzing carbamoyl-phosphate synthase small subunit [Halobacterium zhouii]|uniref:glutamine-hydrolyzing carbamoyl-phosphate synthase small subunit n=1 Tax=Halobacterium zhouii TaxID=2902624 RepID=UPI001E39CB2C|nr:glutamine-hydrolyzing carbamoyl-phosphate synthase small subunit [Halobacterium zhouii]